MQKRAGQDNRHRWQTPEGKQLAGEVWTRLIEQKPLDNLPLKRHAGRFDLRGISAPEVTQEELPPFRNWALHKLQGRLEFRDVQLQDMDFSNSLLKHIQFFNSKIADCCFDGADCEAWGIRATDVTRTTFAGARLRDAVLGPWYEGRGSRYESVSFNQADMRGLISATATYIDCDFSHARLDKIDFRSSSFIRCRFAGEVREVLFYDKAFNTKKPDPNPMEDVDFSEAQLRWVAFRHLNLSRVRLPEDENHLIVQHYPCVLKRALDVVRREQTAAGRGLSRVLGNLLKWVGPEQQIGVFNRLDFQEAWDEEGERFAVDLLRRVEQECSQPQ